MDKMLPQPTLNAGLQTIAESFPRLIDQSRERITSGLLTLAEVTTAGDRLGQKTSRTIVSRDTTELKCSRVLAPKCQHATLRFYHSPIALQKDWFARHFSSDHELDKQSIKMVCPWHSCNASFTTDGALFEHAKGCDLFDFGQYPSCLDAKIFTSLLRFIERWETYDAESQLLLLKWNNLNADYYFEMLGNKLSAPGRGSKRERRNSMMFNMDIKPRQDTGSSIATNFISARSSASQYYSVRSSISSDVVVMDRPRSLFHTILEDQDIIDSWSQQHFWSDEGQHVQFSKAEEIPLEPIRSIFQGPQSTVDEVRCRRIRLARKTMRCNKKLPLSKAIEEVRHLHRLRHSHIIQLVGSYVFGHKFAILLYPVTDMSLAEFLEVTAHPTMTLAPSIWRHQLSLTRFFGCLASALQHIHGMSMRHMDIKPANILVRSPTKPNIYHKAYIADFGISKSFLADDSSQTADITPRTPRYCSPEVFNADSKGRASDIFSMGCVFAEMLTVLSGSDLDSIADFLRDEDMDVQPYHTSLPKLLAWLDQLEDGKDIDLESKADGIKKMLAEEPSERPDSNVLVGIFSPNTCCNQDLEPFAE